MDDNNNDNKKKESINEAYIYTSKKLTTILNSLILDSNSVDVLKISTKGSVIIHYKEFISDRINLILINNNITLDESITLKGAKKYRYYKERLRSILNRINSRLDEYFEYDDSELDSYIELINGYIYKVGSDYDLDLIVLD